MEWSQEELMTLMIKASKEYEETYPRNMSLQSVGTRGASPRKIEDMCSERQWGSSYAYRSNKRETSRQPGSKQGRCKLSNEKISIRKAKKAKKQTRRDNREHLHCPYYRVEEERTA